MKPQETFKNIDKVESLWRINGKHKLFQKFRPTSFVFQKLKNVV